jgi:hypothetical protein
MNGYKMFRNVCNGRNYLHIYAWVLKRLYVLKISYCAHILLQTYYQEAAAACCEFGLQLVAFETVAEFDCVTSLDHGGIHFADIIVTF